MIDFDDRSDAPNSGMIMGDRSPQSVSKTLFGIVSKFRAFKDSDVVYDEGLIETSRSDA